MYTSPAVYLDLDNNDNIDCHVVGVFSKLLSLTVRAYVGQIIRV